MVDKITKEKRSEIRRSIKAQSKLENTVSKALWKRGIRFRKNERTLLGTPDISIKKHKIVIFIDSCFWHGCPVHGKTPSSNIDFWETKISNNKERDRKITSYYEEKGWNIRRVWEHELTKANFDKTIEDLTSFINAHKHTK